MHTDVKVETLNNVLFSLYVGPHYKCCRMHISLPTRRFETSQEEVCLILSTQSLEDLLPAPVAEGLILSL